MALEIKNRTTSFRNVSRNAGILSHQLVDILTTHFLSATFLSEGLFRTALVTRFQIIGMFLYILDDVFLLDLSFETAKRAFNRFALLDSDLCHLTYSPPQAVSPIFFFIGYRT